jgi:hypothetical protein
MRLTSSLQDLWFQINSKWEQERGPNLIKEEKEEEERRRK